MKPVRVTQNINLPIHLTNPGGSDYGPLKQILFVLTCKHEAGVTLIDFSFPYQLCLCWFERRELNAICSLVNSMSTFSSFPFLTYPSIYSISSL